MDDPQLTEWIARGKRLTQIRELLSLNLSELARLLGLSVTTVAYLETLSNGGPGLEPRHATQVARMAEPLGVVVSARWLLTGEGPLPYQLTIQVKAPPNIFHFNVHPNDLRKDVEYLADKWGDNYVTYRMPDDTMLPLVKPGDYIIAAKIAEDMWLDTLHHPNTPALVQLKRGKPLLRLFAIADGNMVCLHPSNVRSASVADTHLWKEKSDIQWVATIAAHFKHGRENINTKLTQG